MNRIYHHYEAWEDYPAGFYRVANIKEREDMVLKVRGFFSCQKTTEKFMRKVVSDWPVSCEQNFSNDSINKIAYLGQAACCIYAGIPCYVTMNAWNYVDFENRNTIKVAKEIEIFYENYLHTRK